ncbi:MAG: hypothetical protein ACI8PB_005179 [Desulforhopalus sp.]|jgi:hypothetical protein
MSGPKIDDFKANSLIEIVSSTDQQRSFDGIITKYIFRPLFSLVSPEKIKTLAMPVDNTLVIYNDESVAPRNPNLGKHNPEE